jgi:hypothetical protein
MEYNKIIAVTGLPGLYELLSSKSDGAIVRSLDDKTTSFVSSRIHNFSHLESIEVYTVRDNVNLVDILKAMEASSSKLPDEKDAAALKAYFTKVYPDLDFTRVYSSDLKKMVKWFSVLKSNDVEIKLSEPEEESEESATEDAEQKPAPVKKAAAQAPAKAEKKSTDAERKPADAEKKSVKPEKKETAKTTEKAGAKKATADAEKPKKAETAAKSAAKGKTEKEAKPKKSASKPASKSASKPAAKKAAKKKK